MDRDRLHKRDEAGDRRPAWRVADDFADRPAIGAAELDAVEAFLMPMINAILSSSSSISDADHHNQPDRHDRHDRHDHDGNRSTVVTTAPAGIESSQAAG